jgi:hypothetical protein
MDTTGSEVPPRVVPEESAWGDVPIFMAPRGQTLGMKIGRRQSNYYVRWARGSVQHYLGRYPLTDSGWQDAWRTFQATDPEGGRLYLERLRDPVGYSERVRSDPLTLSTPASSAARIFGSLIGWGPWSAGVGAFLAYGPYKSGYSASTIHGVCQAGAAAYYPGACGSVALRYDFGLALFVVGGIAFLGGLIGLFVLQPRNPRAWREGGPRILGGLIFGLFWVIGEVIAAIVRAVRQGGGQAASQAIPLAQAPELRQPAARPRPEAVNGPQWRYRDGAGWEWLAADGNWYAQALAPMGAVPPAPPPPRVDY